jgi:hypothetical protein
MADLVERTSRWIASEADAQDVSRSTRRRLFRGALRFAAGGVAVVAGVGVAGTAKACDITGPCRRNCSGGNYYVTQRCVCRNGAGGVEKCSWHFIGYCTSSGVGCSACITSSCTR